MPKVTLKRYQGLKEKKRLVNRDLYYLYCYYYPKSPVTFEVFKEFLIGDGLNPLESKRYGVLQDMEHDIVTNARTYKLPHGLGTIYVCKFKTSVREMKDGTLQRFRPVDYKATKELWARDPKAKEEHKKIYHENRDSNEYIYKIKWSKYGTKISNKLCYKFSPARGFSRMIKKQKELNKNLDYFE